ncbi:MAG: YlbF family regulator [Turicibacter sp.]
MLHTSDYMELTNQIADEIISLPICQKYKALQQEMRDDEALQKLIFAFEKAKEQYAEVERYGHKYHPDYKKVSAQLIQSKTALFEHPLIKSFKACEKEIQEVLNNVALTLSDAIKIKTGRAATGCGCSGGGCSH